jgi:hypothetical protein
VNRSDVKHWVKNRLQQTAGAAAVPQTSRAQLLALSELSRRLGGDVPTGGAVLDLAAYELRVFSQNGEDGVLAEIIRRSGAPGRFFIEFGAFDGVENNCVVLADVQGWSGLYIEGGHERYERLERKYRAIDRVRTASAMVTPGNVESLFAEHGVPEEPDVLAIDVDGGDYWIWEAIKRYRPRIVVIEYNSDLDPRRRLVQPRDHPGWDGSTNYYGASIAALEALAAEKGYRLVHCELSGNNAFFIREDLPGDYVAVADVPRRAPNYWLQGLQHRPDPLARPFNDLDA